MLKFVSGALLGLLLGALATYESIRFMQSWYADRDTVTRFLLLNDYSAKLGSDEVRRSQYHAWLTFLADYEPRETSAISTWYALEFERAVTHYRLAKLAKKCNDAAGYESHFRDALAACNRFAQSDSCTVEILERIACAGIFAKDLPGCPAEQGTGKPL